MPLLPKPEACRACPFYGNGKGYVPDEARPDALVAVVGQNPGAHEEAGERLVDHRGNVKQWEACHPAPFLGDSGYDLERTYLPLAGLARDDVSLHNAIRCRVGGRNVLPPLGRTETREAIKHCQRAHFQPGDARVLIALGEYALWALTGEDGGDAPPYGISRKIGGWRGWLLPYSPFVRSRPTFFRSTGTILGAARCVYVSLHPAGVYEAPWLKPAVLRDWQKLAELLKGTWPRPMPMIERAMTAWPDEFAYDTEFWERGGEQHLTRWSASDGDRVWVVEREVPPPRARNGLRVVLHQADADVDTLQDAIGPGYRLDDTMYAHAALWAELPHDLDFLGSLYARTNRWKHLARAAPVTYAAGDALGTWDVWQALKGELGRDPATERVYRTCLLPLLPIIARARRVGIRVAGDRARQAVLALQRAQREQLSAGQAAAGWPIKLSSTQQLATQFFDVERLGARKAR